jgi:hypothetical protein
MLINEIRKVCKKCSEATQHFTGKDPNRFDFYNELIEKHWKFGKDTVIVFIGFEKANDSIKRENIWPSLRRLKVAEYL